MSTKTYINISNKYERVVVLIDMDCFYCQVEEKLNDNLKGKPIAVVQYNAWKGGGIIAVNYPAREKGVTRHMRGDEAKEHCPDIELVSVPSVREKADLTKYREAGKEVAEVLQTFTALLERASVDEAYLDITERVIEKMKLMDKGMYRLEPTELVNTFAMGYENIGKFVQNLSNIIDKNEFPELNEEDIATYKMSDIKLLVAASIVNQIRAAVKEKTGYDCSAGIAHNKILAKLACGLNKPNKQTILPLKKIPTLLSDLPLNKIKGLGGKFGELVSDKLKIKFISDLNQFTEQELQTKFDEKNGSWLHLIGRGIDLETVTPRFISKSIGCCKKFPGRNAITAVTTLTRWLGELSNEIMERLEKDEIENHRRAKQMTVSFGQIINSDDIQSSRTVTLNSYDSEIIAKDAFDTIKKNTEHFYKSDNNFINHPIIFLGISVGKFENIIDTKKNKIQELFSNQVKKQETQVKKLELQTDDSNDENEIERLEKKILEQNRQDELQLVSEIPTVLEKKDKPSIINFLKPKTVDSINNEFEHAKTQFKEKPEKSKISFFQKILKEKPKDKVESKEILIPQTNENIADDDESNSEIVDIEIAEKTVNVEPQPSTSRDYRNEYAEFLTVTPNAITFEICSHCNQKIPDFEIQSHLDYHFALDLSQQQRVEFRNEIKSKIKISPTSTAKSKNTQTKKSQKSSNNNISIQQFFNNNKSISEENHSTESCEMCSECGKMINTNKLEEHQDFHVAKKLQIELNFRPIIVNKSPANSKNDKKRKRSDVKNESIVTFLKKSA